MRLSRCFIALSLSVWGVCTLSAQTAGDERQEFAIGVGEISGGSPNATAGALTLDSGVSIEANYARKIRDKGWGVFYWEVDGRVAPLRYLTGAPATATNEIRSFYVTPGVKLQFTPKEPISPWIAAGGGYAFYNSSGTSIGGGVTGGGATWASANKSTEAEDFGVGVDYTLNKRYVLRGDVRGIYTGSPNFGASTQGGQWNFVVSLGLVWRFPR